MASVLTAAVLHVFAIMAVVHIIRLWIRSSNREGLDIGYTRRYLNMWIKIIEIAKAALIRYNYTYVRL